MNTILLKNVFMYAIKVHQYFGLEYMAVVRYGHPICCYFSYREANAWVGNKYAALAANPTSHAGSHPPPVP